MVFYRVENYVGKGPYQMVPLNWIDNDHTSENGHPDPFNDLVLNGKGFDYYLCRQHGPRGIFGFRTLEQLHNWFSDKELKTLERSGFCVVEVKGELITESETQCLFFKT